MFVCHRQAASDLTRQQWQVSNSLVKALMVEAPTRENKFSVLKALASQSGLSFDPGNFPADFQHGHSKILLTHCDHTKQSMPGAYQNTNEDVSMHQSGNANQDHGYGSLNLPSLPLDEAVWAASLLKKQQHHFGTPQEAFAAAAQAFAYAHAATNYANSCSGYSPRGNMPQNNQYDLKDMTGISKQQMIDQRNAILQRNYDAAIGPSSKQAAEDNTQIPSAPPATLLNLGRDFRSGSP